MTGISKRSVPHRVWLALGVLTLQLVVMSLPATAGEEGGDGGTVTGRVTVTPAPEACILIGGTLVDFGTLEFGAHKWSGNDPQVDGYEVASCSEGTQDFLVRASDAVGDGGAMWTHGPDPGVNRFGVSVSIFHRDGHNVGVGWLATTNETFWSAVPPGAQGDVIHQISMPTAGSEGAGETMTWDMTWTAVLAD